MLFVGIEFVKKQEDCFLPPCTKDLDALLTVGPDSDSEL